MSSKYWGARAILGHPRPVIAGLSGPGNIDSIMADVAARKINVAALLFADKQPQVTIIMRRHVTIIRGKNMYTDDYRERQHGAVASYCCQSRRSQVIARFRLLAIVQPGRAKACRLSPLAQLACLPLQSCFH